ESLTKRLDERIESIDLTDIELEGDGAPSLLLDLLNDRFGFTLSGAVGEDHISPSGGQLEGALSAEAPVSASNERDFLDHGCSPGLRRQARGGSAAGTRR